MRFAPISKKSAEKMFGRKASPDTDMTPEAFLKRELGKVKTKVSGGAKVVGRAVKSWFK